MKSRLLFMGILLLGPICKDSLAKYLLVEVDESRVGNKAVARQTSATRFCGAFGYYHGPCGYNMPLFQVGQNGQMEIYNRLSMGRADRCEWNTTIRLMTVNDCLGMCESWNRAFKRNDSSTQGFVNIPCVGIETTATDLNSTLGACNLVRSRNPAGQHNLPNPDNASNCPGAPGYFTLQYADTSSGTRSALSGNDLCFYGSNSDNNPNLPDFTCFPIFDAQRYPPEVDICTRVPECPATSG